ncbi:hypothetical protein RUM44_001547 [Polyplax serrata]|uniref:TGF-beta family profile domain-containing protein n=1 Tax=Polyplax serrata TaxID=468196 RepID=A0ABR1AKE6_POLSC
MEASNKKPNPRIRHLPHIQYFEFSDKLRASKVKRALLWMYIKGRESASVVGNKITISIYKILDTGKPGSSGSRESPVITSVRADSTQSIPSGSGAWITMEYIQIRNLVADWFRYPQHNLGIVITAEDGNRTNLAVTSHNGNDTAFVPFLEVYVADNRKHRTKRTIGLNCKDTSNETRCCRYPLTVDFMEFGWDWIIAPTKYEANYCAGECPPVFLPQYPHTHVSQLANTAGNGPCCAPRKLSELEMLYFDNNMNIVFGRIPAMIVDRCGCT